MNPLKRLPLLLVCSVLTAFGLVAAGCSRQSSASGDEEGGGQGLVAEVTLTRVTRADISRILTFTGEVAAPPNQDVRVSALVAGRVAEMRVAEGDRVTSGELVARLDDRPYREQLQQAEAAETQARANRDNAKLALQRNENLFQRGIAARKDLEDARTQEMVTAAALKQAEATLALARLQVSRTEVRSPLTGLVVKRFVSVGEQVDGTAAQPVVEIANVSELELHGNVPATDLGRLHVGEALSFTSEAFSGRVFHGRVVAVSPAVDPATNTGVIRIRIADPGGLLRLGMFLNTEVPIETHRNALGVPPQAIYRDDQGRTQVYKVTGEVATAAPVKVGIETPNRVELLSGAQEGETVILNGGYGLPDKAKVVVKGTAQP